jgi:hypothetical protein
MKDKDSVRELDDQDRKAGAVSHVAREFASSAQKKPR